MVEEIFWMKDLISAAYRKFFPYGKIIRLDPKGLSRGCVALSYITWPFREGMSSPKMRGHTNAYEVLEITRAYLELGYRVEVCDYDDSTYLPPRDCRVAVDIHGNLERWHGKGTGTIRSILHATGTHWLTLNCRELTRLEAVRNRKGIALKPRRQASVSNSVEFADQIVVLGNEFTVRSWEFSRKPIIRVPISSAYEFEWPEGRDLAKAKTRFLWLGSYGMVHKGLDLVLDAFAGMPDLELTVCGRPEKEEDFYRLYEKELKRTPNIHFQGWIDLASPAFAEIARTHAAVIYPSCAEGGAGSVIHCMHAGMIPVCTTEASIDLVDFGVHVASGTVEAVQEACRTVAEMSAAEVEARARAAYEHVRRVHTRERFRENYKKFAASVAEWVSI